MSKIIIASGPVIVEDNKVLLNKHGEDDFWKFCGGRVEEDEHNLKQAAKREAKEEMGIDIEIIDESPYFVYTEKMVDDIKTSVVLVHFLAKRVGEIKPANDIREWKWIELDNLFDEDFAPNIKPALKHFNFIN